MPRPAVAMSHTTRRAIVLVVGHARQPRAGGQARPGSHVERPWPALHLSNTRTAGRGATTTGQRAAPTCQCVRHSSVSHVAVRSTGRGSTEVAAIEPVATTRRHRVCSARHPRFRTNSGGSGVSIAIYRGRLLVRRARQPQCSVPLGTWQWQLSACRHN